MAFVNEYISSEDKVKYNIEELSRLHQREIYRWTADKENEVFLVSNGRGRIDEGNEGSLYFLFYWKVEWVEITISSEYRNGPSHKIFQNMKVTQWDDKAHWFWKSVELTLSDRIEFFDYLKIALVKFDEYATDVIGRTITFENFS